MKFLKKLAAFVIVMLYDLFCLVIELIVKTYCFFEQMLFDNAFTLSKIKRNKDVSEYIYDLETRQKRKQNCAMKAMAPYLQKPKLVNKYEIKIK